MRVLIADKIHESGKELFKGFADVEDGTALSKEELLKKVEAVDALIVRSKTKVTKDVIDAAKKLKVIGRAGVGVDNIDLDAATGRGIVVVNAPESTSITVAEHTIGLMLGMARKIPFADASLKSRKWEKSKFMGMELRGKTLGVIGLGRIGSEVTRKAHAFGMKIHAYDPYISDKSAKELGVELVEFDELLASSDFVTIHVPLTEQTKKFIGKKEFSKMKEGAVLLNCARGGIVDEDALYKALSSGKLGGAAVDVFEKEPATDSPLLELDNVIVTPHLGASTAEAQKYASTIVCEEVMKVLKNIPPRNVVNMPALAPEVLEELKPYLPLAEALGKFTVQLVEGYVRDVSITYCGSLVEVKGLNILTNAILMELLSPVLANEVNILNSSVIAKNRGVRITEGKREDAEMFANLIILDIKTSSETTVTKGILLGEEPRIVGIADYTIDLVPKGRILLAVHEDRPGMIGKVATALGERNINIGSMQVGRKDRGGVQLMVLTLDQDLSRDDVEAITAIDGITKVGTTKL
ncbi:MAG: phosphoglycerate dehydrogenase [Candidatus Hydrothermarchaeales archaeon]